VARKDNPCEGSDGTTVTTANSDDNGGNAFDLVNIGAGTICAYEVTGVIHGTSSIRLQSSTTTSTVQVGWTDTGATSAVARWYENFTTLPTALMQHGVNFRGNTGATSLARTEINTDGTFRCVMGATTGSYSGSALSTGTTYRFEAVATGFNGGSGTITVTAYVGESGSAYTSATVSGATTSFTCDTVRFGKFNGAGNFDALVDSLAANIGSSTPIGAVPLDATPTPAVVGRTATVPAPTVTATGNITPAVVPATSSVPAVTVTTGSTVQAPSVAAAVADVPDFEASVSSTVDVTAVARTSAVGAPTTTASSTVDVAAVAGQVINLGSPIADDYVIGLDSDVTDAPLGVTAMLYTSGGSLKETVVFQVVDKVSAFGFTNVFVSPSFAAVSAPGDVLRMTPWARPSSVPAPTVQGDVQVTATAVARVAAVGVAAVLTDQTVAATAVGRTASVPSVTVQTGQTVTPATVSATATVLTPGVSAAGNTSTTPGTISASSVVAAPSISAGSSVQPSTAARTSAVGVAAVTAHTTVLPGPAQPVASVPDPAVSATGAASISATSIARVALVPGPTVVTDASIAHESLALTASVPVPLVSAGVTVQPAAAVASAVINTPRRVGPPRQRGRLTSVARRTPTLAGVGGE
jgi:hypothetical protein